MQLDQLAARPGPSLDCLDSHKKWTDFRGLVSNNIENLEAMWPWEHAAVDPFRFYTGPTP